MTSEPIEPNPAHGTSETGTPAADLGVGGPADDAGDAGQERTPPGYPDDVDPTEGPVTGRGDSGLGDLEDPGASAQG